MISVDHLLDARAPGLAQRPWLGPTARLALRYLTHEQAFQDFERDFPHLKGLDFVDQVLEYFDFSYAISDQDLERLPVEGRAVIVANHPLGSLDGLALVKLVSRIRPDVKIVANDLLMALEPLRELLMPVDNMGGRTAKSGLKAIHQHLNQDGCLIIFPAGEVSRLSFAGVKDGKWNTGFLRMAKAAEAPIVPVHLDARNSLTFYMASAIFKPYPLSC